MQFFSCLKVGVFSKATCTNIGFSIPTIQISNTKYYLPLNYLFRSYCPRIFLQYAISYIKNLS